MQVIEKRIVKNASKATFSLFFIFGILVNSWYSRLPSISESMNLSALQLSQILIIGAIGSVFGLPFVGYLNERLGARKVIRFSIGGFILMMTLVLYGFYLKSIVLVCLFLFIAQFVMSFCEGTINIEGGRIELAMQKSILSAYHGGFSLGTLVSAFIASIVSYFEVPFYHHLLGIYFISLVLMIFSTKFILPFEYLRTIFHAGYKKPVAQTKTEAELKAEKKAMTYKAWTEKRTLLIGVTILGSALTEASANDWLSLSLVQSFGASESFGAFVLGVFVAFMTATRLIASPLINKFGRVKLLRTCTFIGGIGLLIFVFSPNVYLCIVGAVAWAIGSALGFPIGMSAASDDPRMASARVSVTSTIAYIAFFLGPAVLGAIAEFYGYRLALLAIIVPITVALIFIPVLAPLSPEETGMLKDTSKDESNSAEQN